MKSLRELFSREPRLEEHGVDLDAKQIGCSTLNILGGILWDSKFEC